MEEVMILHHGVMSGGHGINSICFTPNFLTFLAENPQTPNEVQHFLSNKHIYSQIVWFIVVSRILTLKTLEAFLTHPYTFSIIIL